MRLNEQSRVRATDLASIVLPIPGTSSMSTCPSHNSATSNRSITSRLPTMTCSMFRPARSAIARIGSTSIISMSPVGETVADAALGHDVARVRGIVLEFLTQVVDVQPNVVRGVAVFGPPDPTEQRLVGHYDAWIRGKVIQQAKFGRT